MNDMNPPPLVDELEREKAANDLSTSYLVEAAAGTGKTTLLVSRILTIVRETLTPLGRVVAITFTEKAAGELKTKLKEILEQCSIGNDEGAERCRSAMLELDLMPVSTIHAFCRDLLSQLPVEAGVDPSLRVADETESRTLADEFWQSWISEEFRRECPAAQPFLAAGMPVTGRENQTSLRALFDLLNEHRDALNELHVPALSDEGLLNRVATFRNDLVAELSVLSKCKDTSDLCARELLKVQQWLQSETHGTLEDGRQWLLSAPTLSRRGGKSSLWQSNDDLQHAKMLRDQFPERLVEISAAFTSYDAAPSVKWLKSGVQICNEARLQRGILDFQDLLILARNMLHSNRAARDFFKTRYDYLLVDEFQDTDPLQTEIVFYLAERSERFAADWVHVEVEQGKLFIVGDPKQSIYRFRRADLDLYGRVRSKMQESGEVLAIRMNFRSEPAVVREVNAVFRELMRGPKDGRYEPEYVAMEAYRPASDAAPKVVILPPPLESEENRHSNEMAAAEAACIAEYIRELTGQHEARDQNRYRDIAILYPVASHLHDLETALRSRTIPYQISGGKNLYRRNEIQALQAAIAAIDNPQDGVNVVGALRSPFFGCSDDDLLAHRFADGDFDYTSRASSNMYIERCFTVLRRLHDARRNQAPSEVLGMLFNETAGLQVFALKPQGDMRVANLLKILDTARALEAAGNGSFHSLTGWLNRIEEFRVGEDDFAAAEPDTDAVQLMTFHKAKGLEFPTVILYRLTHGYGNQKTTALVNRTNRHVEFRAAGGETSDFSEALGKDQDRQYHETMRLLYVAMTRARNRLVLPLGWSSMKSPKDKQWLISFLEPRYGQGTSNLSDMPSEDYSIHDTSNYDLNMTQQEGLLLDPSALPDTEVIGEADKERERWLDSRNKAASTFRRDEYFLRPSQHTFIPSKNAHSDMVEPKRPAVQFGSFVHRVLEHLVLPHGTNLAELIELYGDEFGVKSEQRVLAREILMRALTSRLISERIAAASAVYRELPFTFAKDDRLIEGAMDLVFREKENWVIVDFKTDAVDASQVETRAETYRHQAALYLEALEDATKAHVSETILYFLRPDVTFSFPRGKFMS